MRLKNGKTLLLEVKGEETDQAKAKHQAAYRRVAAVNNWGRLGVWEFAVCKDPQMLPGMLGLAQDVIVAHILLALRPSVIAEH